MNLVTKNALAFATVSMLAAATVFPAMAEEARVAKISVSGEGEINIAPDMAIVSMGVTREAKTAREALTANTEAMAKVLDAMKAAGIEDRDLQTSNFSIQPQYFYPKPSDDGTQAAPVITGYIVSNNLSVRIRDLAAVGDILDASVTLGVNNGGNLIFTNDNPDAAITEARTKAMKNAIDKAKTLSGAAEVELGKIVEISEQSYGQPQPIPMMRAAKMEMAMDSAAVPIAAGENTYRVSVNVTFEIDQ